MEWKIKRDYFYSDLYLKYGLDWIKTAGFFFDSYKEDWNLEDHVKIQCTPINFMRESYSVARKPIVLVSTGSFCPVHDGHIEAMEAAKRVLTERGWDVIGGLLCPDHDEYVSSKVKKGSIPIHIRLELIERKVRDRKWLAADPWGGIFVECDVNFTDVIRRTELYLKKYLGENVEVAFVCGGDCANFAMTFDQKGICVIVSRPGYAVKANHYYQRYSESNRIFLAEANNGLSSTEVRKTFDYSSEIDSVIVRTDQSGVESAILISELTNRFDKIRVNAVREQRLQFMKAMNGSNVISLDPLIHLGHKFEISRLYDCFGMKMLGYTNRPGSPSLEDQLKIIPDGEYVLYDDDTATGGTLNFAKEMLENSGKKIIGYYTLSRALPTEEIIDIRDFVKGKEQSGLVVKGADGQIKRLPYLDPHINLYSRSSIIDPVEFSKNVMKINRKFGYD